MVDAHGLGPCGVTHGGSSPLPGTSILSITLLFLHPHIIHYWFNYLQEMNMINGNLNNKKTQKDYDESDMKVVYSRGLWESWDDIVGWLKESGEEDNELTPGEVEYLIKDIENLKNKGIEFTYDYKQAYDLAKKNRTGNKKGQDIAEGKLEGEEDKDLEIDLED